MKQSVPILDSYKLEVIPPQKLKNNPESISENKSVPSVTKRRPNINIFYFH